MAHQYTKQRFLHILLGKRRDYDVAKILFENEILERAIIDIYYSTKRYPILHVTEKHQILTRFFQRIQTYRPNIPEEKIISSWITGILFKIRLSTNKAGNYFKAQIQAYKSLNHLAISYLNGCKNTYSVYAYDTAALEVFTWSKNNRPDAKLVLEQCVAPRSQQIKMYKHLHKYFPEKQVDKLIHHCTILRRREVEEWNLADLVLVPSEFVLHSLIEEGVPKSKIRLLPYGFTPSTSSENILKNLDNKNSNSNRNSYKVLFVGNSGYRKGLHDLIEIAKRLKKDNFQFFIAGKIEATFNKTDVPSNVIFLGKLQKTELDFHYLNSDLFFFPSYLEGSALSTYEAMSMGLPVVTTFESGSVVRNEIDGYLHSAGDLEGMIKSIRLILNNENLRKTMALSAFYHVQDYSIENYRKRLIQIIHESSLA